ncbi:MAG TPA: hypothetical protein VGA13_09540 [Acidimicrobiales bacterium]|jgi:hypothetical protein
MSALVFLGLAVIASLVGSVIVSLRAREPTTLESGIEEFERGLAALRPRVPPPMSEPVWPRADVHVFPAPVAADGGPDGELRQPHRGGREPEAIG